MSLIWFIEKNVTVKFFIYFIFLPISIIPTIIINHAGRCTLPYSKCGKVKKRRKSSGGRGLHLARYHVSLRNKATIICPRIITTFKGGRRFSRPVRSPKTSNPIVTHPITHPTQRSFSASDHLITHPTQRSFSASDQVDALIADDPSLSLDLFLFNRSYIVYNSI
jgi:hypothetical protein